MNKKIRKYVIAVIVIVALSACGTKVSAPTKNGSEPQKNQMLQITSQSGLDSSDKMVATTIPGKVKRNRKLTEVKSSFGYSISYEEDKFDYRRTVGYDQFIMKSDKVDRPYVFVCIARVEKENFQEVKAAVMNGEKEPCIIGPSKIKGERFVKTEDWEEGKIIHSHYFCPLGSAEALLIETQWYTRGEKDPYSEMILEMVNRIKR